MTGLYTAMRADNATQACSFIPPASRLNCAAYASNGMVLDGFATGEVSYSHDGSRALVTILSTRLCVETDHCVPPNADPHAGQPARGAFDAAYAAGDWSTVRTVLIAGKWYVQ